MHKGWPFPRVLAHRGGGTLAPENTLAALRCALTYGQRAVEFDVMLAHGDVPVLIHDESLGRTVAGSGAVAQMTAADLAAADAGSWFGPAFFGEPLPRYLDAIDFCARHRLWMNVEIKPSTGAEARTGAVVAATTLAALRPGQAIPLLSSFSFDALVAARDVAPDLPRGWLVERIPTDWQERLDALDAVALHVNQRHLSASQAREVKNGGYGLFCYTVNGIERARELLSYGVDAFCTDRIDLIGADFSPEDA